MAAKTTVYHADYTIREPIKNNKSAVDGYFNKPAVVRLEDGHYKVIINIITNHDLGSFPFQVIRINGLEPEVEKKTLGQQDYYTFSFITQDVHQKIYGLLKVDIVSSNYHYQGGFNIDLDAKKIPLLTEQTTKSVVATGQTETATSKKVSERKTAASTSVTQKAALGQETAGKQTDTEMKQSRSTSTKKTIDAANNANSNLKDTNKATAAAKKKTASFDTGKILLVLGIVLALGVGGWGLVSNYRG
ncbi:hypothetical protein FC81_GL001711 [Liquorilactobacillus capillatus DSM 19910]|uniref:NEAT domain-containing protein n=1 Tax=Liquorilactobacillus capillatus DSM 19910 TaxID=1423731 RepID=A0A0R1LYX4_9LACO|nr:hypothetical protein FC81_GL001711 [Liquorilactobacillus capillatus DSM 19910]